MPRDVTVVVPVHNNAATLAELCRRVRRALPESHIVLVDDASTDDSVAVARALDVDVIALPTRHGQSEAIRRGLARAVGRVCCILDADLEDPPEALPRLVAALDGRTCRVAFSSREGRRKLTSRLFRGAMRLLYPSLPPRACLCFAIDRAAADDLVRLASPRDYLVAAIGALRLPAVEVPVAREPRDGRSGYTGASRTRHGLRMLRAAVRLRLRPPVRRAASEEVADV